MHHRTHFMLTKRMAPYISDDVIKKVSRALDSPSKSMIGMSSAYRDKKNRTPFDFPGLVKYSHRKNHDVLSATLTGLQAGGIQGAIAANIHLAQDALRDKSNRSFGGARSSDVIESILNYYWH